jgi:hypothetical protein
MTEREREKFEREVEMITFYDMSQRYGFCTPYCECGLCDKDIRDALI